MDALKQQIKYVLEKDGGWMLTNAVYQRVDARSKDDLAAVLESMAKAGEIQQSFGPLGCEYALPGVAGKQSPRPAKVSHLPASTATTVARPARQAAPPKPRASAAPPPPKAPPAPAPQPDAPRMRRSSTDVLAAVIEAIKAGPKQVHEIAAAAALSTSVVLRHLGRLVESGQVTRGEGRHAKFTLVPTTAGEPPRPVRVVKAQPQPAIAETPATPPPATGTRFALWSTGEFVMERGGERIVLDVADTRAMFHYLDRVVGDLCEVSA